MEEDEIKMSFASADVPFPAKLLHHNGLLLSTTISKFIPPIHIQLNITNRCNFNCSFCSCKKRNKTQELTYEQIMDVMKTGLGTEAVTITGGGEPLMHPKINEIINGINSLGIEIGLVTNGTLLHKLDTKSLNKLTWCRISSSDELDTQLARIGMSIDDWFDKIENAVSRAKIDWAFSHVVTKPNINLIARIVEFANTHKFTHVRLVNDIFNADKLEKAKTMDKIKNELKLRKIDDSIVNYQKRDVWTKGTSKCYISLLKPVLGADGYWYPCCGTQYALAEPSYDYEPTMRMTDKKLSEGLKDIIEHQKYFNGSRCVKCYYSNYNYALKIMLSEIKHKKFL